MYYIGIKTDSGEWRIVKSCSSKEAAVLAVKRVRDHKLTAAVFVIKEGKYRKLVNI